MLLSIVTPVRNDPRVEQALASVFAQRGAEVESIVVDSTSDGTSDPARKRWGSSVARWIDMPAEGIYPAMNLGIGKASGDVVGILNADDCYADEDVAAAVEAAFADAEAEVAIGGAVYVTAGGRVVRRWPSRQPTRTRLRLGWMPAHAGLFVRADTYRRHGLYDPSYPIAADYEWMFRVLFEGRAKAAVIPRVVTCVSPGGHSNRSPAAVGRGAAEVARVWRASGRRWGPAAAACKLARHAGQAAAAACSGAR